MKVSMETPRKSIDLAGEKKLMAAVLAQAWRDLLDVDSSARKRALKKLDPVLTSRGMKAKDDAYEWFMDDTVEPRSFLWICLVLDYSAENFRRFITDVLPTLSWEERKKLALRLPGSAR